MVKYPLVVDSFCLDFLFFLIISLLGGMQIPSLYLDHHDRLHSAQSSCNKDYAAIQPDSGQSLKRERAEKFIMAVIRSCPMSGNPGIQYLAPCEAAPGQVGTSDPRRLCSWRKWGVWRGSLHRVVELENDATFFFGFIVFLDVLVYHSSEVHEQETMHCDLDDRSAAYVNSHLANK